jgi:hypothetical protein
MHRFPTNTYMCLGLSVEPFLALRLVINQVDLCEHTILGLVIRSANWHLR